ncbi:MAG: response regulator [Thermotogota bacterium]|nr:response regulator [Thermotogota bacterium]
MKRCLFETIMQYFVNGVNDDNDAFSCFLAKKNFTKLFFFMFFSIFALFFVLILSEINNEYTDIIWSRSLLLVFTTIWVILLRVKKKSLNHKSQWLFFIPTVVYLLFVSYLLGNYSYRSFFFSSYTAVIFILAIIYTAKWQTTALLFLGSIVYMRFLTSFGKTGPSSYTSSNLLAVSVILVIAWVFSRIIYFIYKNEYKSQREIKNFKKTIQEKKEENDRLKEELQNIKYEFTEKLNERTEELNEAKLEAEELDRTKSLFLANISHELRTPLSGIIGTLEIITEGKITQEERISMVQIALESSAELKRIIDELMEISRLRSGHFEVSEISFNPKRLFLQSIDLFKISAKEKGIEFKTNFEGLPKKIISDPNRIKQIVDNLLGNAVKFTNEGFVHSSFKLKKNEQNVHSLVIVIEDTGIGMDENTQKKLFDYFYQEDSSLQKKYSGIGLGLTLVKHYIQQFEGIINLKSNKQKGTRFEVIIPIKGIEETQKTFVDLETKRLLISTIKTVLIVEDNRINRFILRKILQEYHLKVFEAENGEKAIEIFKEHQTDLIFMDIQMPIMDGYQAMKEIHKLDRGKEIPIIALTGYASAEDKKRILDMGFDDYLAKPFEKEGIINCIQKTEKGEYDEKKSGKYNG